MSPSVPSIFSTVEGQEIVAHRGASEDAPENTLAAFRLAWEQGADAIEGDFYLTSDGQIVCIHDRSTKRTAGGVDLDVTKTPLARLRQLDVGSWKDARFRDERIPTIQEVLQVVPPGKKIFIEIKSGPEILPAMIEVLDHCLLKREQLVVICFNKEVIAGLKKQRPAIKAYWLTGYKKDKVTGRFSPTKREVLETLRTIGADGLDSEANNEMIDEAFVRMLREANMYWHVWTVDDAATARRMAALGVDSITTNRPGELRRLLQPSTAE